MHDRGAIAPGKTADFLLLSDLETFEIEQVYKKGELVYESARPYVQEMKEEQFPEHFYQSEKLCMELTKNDFNITIPEVLKAASAGS